MPLLKPDPTFYPSPKMAMQSPPEKLAYLALINPKKDNRPDAIGVVDVDPNSKSYGKLVGSVDMTKPGDELHHFGWNACSSCLCPYAPHPHMERRYLIVPGINTSRIHVIDTKPDPKNPKVVKVIEPQVLLNARVTPLPTRFTADLTASTSARLARQAAMDLAGRWSWIQRHSRSKGNGRSIVDRSSWPMTSGGTWASTPWSPARGARLTW